jgi:hypothetical protein
MSMQGQGEAQEPESPQEPTPDEPAQTPDEPGTAPEAPTMPEDPDRDPSQKNSQAKALLTILIATGEKAIEAFRASANPVDADFLMELERIIGRSRKELDLLAQKDGSAPS